jgi:hypothetical protein
VTPHNKIPPFLHGRAKCWDDLCEKVRYFDEKEGNAQPKTTKTSQTATVFGQKTDPWDKGHAGLAWDTRTGRAEDGGKVGRTHRKVIFSLHLHDAAYIEKPEAKGRVEGPSRIKPPRQMTLVTH